MVIDLRRTDDARDVVHRAVQALAEGRAVAFPTETDYVVAASVRHEAAAERLRSLTTERPGEPRLSLALKSADEALDWAPRLSPLGAGPGRWRSSSMMIIRTASCIGCRPGCGS